MAEPINKELKILVTFDPDSNSFSSLIVTPDGTSPEFILEALKLCVLNMVKSASWYSDPIVRENIEIASKSMRLTLMGADAAIKQQIASRQAIGKEIKG